MTTTRIPCIGGPLDGQQADGHVVHFGVDMADGSDSYGYSREEFQGMRFFVADTMGFLAARREMRRLYAAREDEALHPPGSYGSQQALDAVLDSARHTMSLAEMLGVVLTITQRPLTPLGQGHYETVVEVRPVQVPT